MLVPPAAAGPLSCWSCISSMRLCWLEGVTWSQPGGTPQLAGELQEDGAAYLQPVPRLPLLLGPALRREGRRREARAG